MSVSNAGYKEYDQHSFRTSRVGYQNKGFDIIAKRGAHVLSSIEEFILYTDFFSIGSNVALTLGTQKIYCCAHSQTIETKRSSFV